MLDQRTPEGLGIALSVIIPVYNAERTLREALDSVLGQSLRNIEVLCVDDGSTDSSRDIVREYAEKDARVRLLEQKNLYAGVARNTGIGAARGDWLFFLDADDAVLDYALEAAYNKCVKYDLDCLKFRSLTRDEGTGRYTLNRRNDFSDLRPGDFNRLLRLSADSPLLKISVAPWSGMYRRAFVMEKNCRFNALQCVNDRSFYTKIITNAERIMCSLDRVTLHRVNQEGSLVGRKASHFACQIESIVLTERQLREDGAPEDTMELIMRAEYTDLLVWYSRAAGDPERKKDMDRQLADYLRKEDPRWGIILQDKLLWIAEPRERVSDPEAHPFHEACAHPRVSVVVPIMNVEDYLNLALDSLTNQTLEEMEFILLNDGSTDRSMTIMREYAAVDKRFQIIDKENTGYGHTMNLGLDTARGDYVGILEPDDFAAPEMFERLYTEASRHRLDFVKADFLRFWINPDGSMRERTVRLCPDRKYYNRTLCPGKKRETFFFIIHTWCGLYSRAFLNDNRIRHNETPGASFQDNGFWFQTFCLGKRVRFIPDVLYRYRRDNPNSSMLSRKKEKCITEEYGFIRKWLAAHPAEETAFLPIMYDKQLGSMLLTWSRLEADRKLPYLQHIREELAAPYEQNLFDRSYLNPKQWERLDQIMKDPAQVMAHIDISVIIPVYNAEKYLEECLRSVLFRSDANLEVICVDDGSTDRSPEILRKLAEKDQRIRILTTGNQGAGAARNAGLREARGEYLSFLDADDFFEMDMLDRAWNKARREKLDLVVFSSDNFLEDKQAFTPPQGIRKELLPENRPFAGTDIPKDTFRLFVGWAWDKLFRTEWIREMKLAFAELPSSNDLSFVFAAVAAAKRIGILPGTPLAHHRRYSGSISTGRDRTWDCYYKALLELRENLKRLGLFERFERDFVNYALYFSFWQMTTVSETGYRKMYEHLTGEWFAELGVYGKPGTYFYDQDNYKMMRRMKDLAPTDFLLYSHHYLRSRVTELTVGLDPAIQGILDSPTYKAGKAVTWLPRKVRSGMRVLKSEGAGSAVKYGLKRLRGGD